MPLFENPSDLSDYLFRIVDNGGSSADRYTVAFSDGSYLALSGSPSHPQGVSQWGEDIDPSAMQDWVHDGEAVDLALGDLPPAIVKHILFRNNEGTADFLKSVEDRNPKDVARTRDDASVHEGLRDSFGKGIYVTEEGYRVRLDGDAEDDRGPYATAREVVLATLPDKHGFAGDEYHPDLDVMSMEPSDEVKASIEKMEARSEAGASPTPGM